MKPDRTYRCRVFPCTHVKGVSNHWFAGSIDKNGLLSFQKFTSMQEFEKAAKRHGAIEICSEACMHSHLSRWAGGKVTAAEKPACASPAVLDEARGELTCWVSDIYKSHSQWAKDGVGQYSETRIVNYMDDGQKRSIWCFHAGAFERVERTAGSYAKFKVKRRGEYVNVIDVLETDGHYMQPRKDATA